MKFDETNYKNFIIILRNHRLLLILKIITKLAHI